MSNLNAFLNPIKEENAKVVASKRFVGENGKPVEWEIKCVTPKEYKQMKKDCTKRVQLPGKRGVYIPETDIDAVLCKLAVTCIVYPNLNDVDLQNGYGVMGAENLLQTMLLAGEYDALLVKVQEINGFDTLFDEKVEEAKN